MLTRTVRALSFNSLVRAEVAHCQPPSQPASLPPAKGCTERLCRGHCEATI